MQLSGVSWSCFIRWQQKHKHCSGHCLGHPKRARRGLGHPEAPFLSRDLELGGRGQQGKGSRGPGSRAWWLHIQVLADTSGQCGYGQIPDPSVPQFPHECSRSDKDDAHVTESLGGLSQLAPRSGI